MKILLTGANGLTGQKIVYKCLNNPDIDLLATSKGECRIKVIDGYKYKSLDITNKNDVDSVIKEFNPDVIINTAAMTNVDACELDHENCKKLNVDAVNYLCSAIINHAPSCFLVHLSTDFIFDGENGPYKEEDKADPLSYYGQSKLDAENLILSFHTINYAILRTVLVYGFVDQMSRTNIVLWAKEALENGKRINVVNDQFRTPTLAEDLAEGCLLSAKKQIKGIFNISGKDFMSILELVYKVADFWKLNKNLITPSSSVGINQPAKRPPKTGFIIEKAISELEYKPHSFEEGLEILNQQLISN
jgi:dTDP-4-dehydrorhamnose reductase